MSEGGKMHVEGYIEKGEFFKEKKVK